MTNGGRGARKQSTCVRVDGWMGGWRLTAVYLLSCVCVVVVAERLFVMILRSVYGKGPSGTNSNKQLHNSETAERMINDRSMVVWRLGWQWWWYTYIHTTAVSSGAAQRCVIVCTICLPSSKKVVALSCVCCAGWLLFFLLLSLRLAVYFSYDR